MLRKAIGSRTVLLLSRLGREGQDALLQRKVDLRSDIVIAGLPDHDEPLSEPLLDAIHPKVILVVDSETPATRRAPARLQDRLGRRGARVFYCREAGALTVGLRAGRIEVTDATGEVLWAMVD
jgi:beta-lactamase superfamily II metal-dependent hydrolase